MQGLEELDYGILIAGQTPFKPKPAVARFTIVPKHGLAKGGVPSVMEEGRLIGGIPKAAGEKLAISGEKPGAPGRLVLIERLFILTRGVAGANVMNLEIAKERNFHDSGESIDCQPGLRQIRA